jgi:ferritin-like metal-binding protein YciE
MAETIEDRLVTYLRDAHALEQMSLQMTETAAKATDDPSCPSSSSTTTTRSRSTSG